MNGWRWRIILMVLIAVLLGMVLTLVSHAKSNDSPPPKPATLPVTTDCSADTPFGEPSVPGSIKVVCKTGYLAYFDTKLKVPRLVAYPITGDQTFGCIGRYKSFHTEPQLSIEERSTQTDYRNSNFDLGHNAPDQDMSSDINRVWDSYSMVNVSPQLPEFNRQGWEQLEQDVRDWAWMRGEVLVYTGSIFVGPVHQTIGSNAVAVPEKFYKIIVDSKTHETIAFIMANVPTAKGDMGRFRASITEVENESGITFPLPDDVDKSAKPDMWPTNDSGWRRQHKVSCSTHR